VNHGPRRLTQAIEQALRPASGLPAPSSRVLGELARYGEPRPERERPPEERRLRKKFERNRRQKSLVVKGMALAEWGGNPNLLSGDQCKQRTGLPADEFWRAFGIKAAEKLPQVEP
jgi:hypothetical protein